MNFASDYLAGAHPGIMDRLLQTNMEQTAGYGTDPYSEAAREKIRAACGCEKAEVAFFTGGTQTNATVISAYLKSYEGVISADTGHIHTHEGGAVELHGHKIFALPQRQGKLAADTVRDFVRGFHADENREHMVWPAMVYISHPTEFGALYTLRELRELNEVCRAHGLFLYLDGARLAYGLACPENDVSLSDLAALCDAFYIGGTKCGALFGEALVLPESGTIPHLTTIMKQHGALLAKGRMLGLQFDTLFTDDLYLTIGRPAIEGASRIRHALKEKGIPLFHDTPTNQIFPVLDDATYARWNDIMSFSFWEKTPQGDTVIRIATSWATRKEDVSALIEAIR